MPAVRERIRDVERLTGKGFGAKDNPLLVSVRSGAAMSIPGMMDTVLNLGLNKNTLSSLAEQTGNYRFVLDSYRRFIQLIGKVALGVSDEYFDEQLENVKKRAAVQVDLDLSANDLEEVCARFLEVVTKHTGQPFPDDAYEQLEVAIKAVFGSWMGKRAMHY